MFGMAEPALPDGYHRAVASDDVVEEAAAHMQSVFLAESGRPFLSVEDYDNFWRAPYMDPGRDVVLVRDGDGALVAQAIVMNRSPFTDPSCFAAVSPEHCGRGLGTVLLAWEETRARERLVEAPAGARVAMAVFVDAEHEPSARLMADHGYEVDRYFLTMTVDFDDPPPAAEFPTDLELRPFTPDQLEAAVAAATDAFRDHYGFVERPAAESVEEIGHAMEHPEYDPTLWWHVYEGDEMVANCWCTNNHEGDKTIGYVQSLGVRKPWRGRRLGRNLLLHAFGEFYRRGMRGAALDVDAHSLTGATRLYESVGMAEEHRNATYIKELRPGQDLATRSL